MKTKQVIIQKVPLEDLIDLLVEIYEKGANYIDIVGTTLPIQDNFTIAVKECYYEPIEEEPEDTSGINIEDTIL